MAYPYKLAGNRVLLSVRIPDVSTPKSEWIVPGFQGRIRKISSVIDGAITVANAVLTTEIGGTLVTGSSITIAFSGSAAGDVDQATPTGANTFTDSQAIECITDGASTTAAACTVTYEIEPI